MLDRLPLDEKRRRAARRKAARRKLARAKGKTARKPARK
jgi:hypothetical protein